jgi:hypothetical protein
MNNNLYLLRKNEHVFALNEENVSTSKDIQQREHSLFKDKQQDSCNVFLKNCFMLLFVTFSFIFHDKNKATMTTK